MRPRLSLEERLVRRAFLAQLNLIYDTVPDAATRLLARLRQQRCTPLMRVLMGGIISHQTTSKQTRLAGERLWAQYRTVERLTSADPGRIEGLIRNAGLGRTKARRLDAIAQDIKERWGGERQLARYLRSAPIEDARQALLEPCCIGNPVVLMLVLSASMRVRGH